MNLIQAELLLTLLFIVSLTAYWKGRKNNINMLKDIGFKGSTVLLILIITLAII